MDLAFRGRGQRIQSICLTDDLPAGARRVDQYLMDSKAPELSTTAFLPARSMGPMASAKTRRGRAFDDDIAQAAPGRPAW